MNLKQLYHKYKEKWLNLWHTGKLQRIFRITYDIGWNIILFFLIAGSIGAFFAGGIGLGYFASLVNDEPVRDPNSMEQAIYNYEETSRLYFAGDTYLGDVQSDLQRDDVKLDNVSDTLINAVIATEDEYFRTHNGIVPKAIFRALVQEVTGSHTQSGGSTLTQQLIKNQILTNEVSFERKAKEILLAMRLENFFDKDEILEAYLNVVPYGREASGQNIAGVQTAAQGIFGVNAGELSLPQAAYLAGLPQNPYSYTPFKNHGGQKDDDAIKPGINRMHTVLERMYDGDYISKQEYEQAINYDITDDFTQERPSTIEEYPYLTFELQKRAKDIIKQSLAEDEGITKEELEQDDKLNEKYSIMAKRAIRQKGYHIHSTIDKKLYDALQSAVKNFDHYGPNWKGNIELANGDVIDVNQRVETGAYMIENSTGKTLAFVGGRGYSQDHELNFATGTTRQNGSTMKPILDYGPAMQEGYIQPGSPLLDAPMKDYDADNVNETFSGIVPARHALTQSINVPTIRLYKRIKDENMVEKYLRPMGITSIGDNEYQNPSLAIGAPTHGVSVEENTNAFSTFGNGGEFNDAYMIDSITDGDGNVIYEKEQESKSIFSPATNYLTIDIMRDVMDKGTGQYAKSYLNHQDVDWFGKTGTSQDTRDLWFVGGNPNITLGTWMGYKYDKSLECDSCSLPYYKKRAKLWASLMNKAADARPDVILPDERFERPDEVVEKSYCAVSGMLPSSLCEEAGLVKTDLFNKKYVPTEEDDSLMKGSYVTVGSKPVAAGPDTPEEFIQGEGLTFNPEFLKRNDYDELDDLTDLYSKLNPEAWKNISVPETELSSSIKHNNGPPNAPSSLDQSNNRLTWDASGSSDVVGYRIYRADSSDAPLNQVGHTTGQSYSIGHSDGIYQVKAVDYDGLESSASTPIQVGSPNRDSTTEEEKDKDKNEDQKDNQNNDDKTDQDQDSSSDDNNSSNKDNNNNDNSNNDSNNDNNDNNGKNDNNNDNGNGHDKPNNDNGNQ